MIIISNTSWRLSENCSVRMIVGLGLVIVVSISPFLQKKQTKINLKKGHMYTLYSDKLLQMAEGGDISHLFTARNNCHSVTNLSALPLLTPDCYSRPSTPYTWTRAVVVSGQGLMTIRRSDGWRSDEQRTVTGEPLERLSQAHDRGACRTLGCLAGNWRSVMGPLVPLLGQGIVHTYTQARS